MRNSTTSKRIRIRPKVEKVRDLAPVKGEQEILRIFCKGAFDQEKMDALIAYLEWHNLKPVWRSSSLKATDLLEQVYVAIGVGQADPVRRWVSRHGLSLSAQLRHIPEPLG